jgi:hypothetical protein
MPGINCTTDGLSREGLHRAQSRMRLTRTNERAWRARPQHVTGPARRIGSSHHPRRRRGAHLCCCCGRTRTQWQVGRTNAAPKQTRRAATRPRASRRRRSHAKRTAKRRSLECTFHNNGGQRHQACSTDGRCSNQSTQRRATVTVQRAKGRKRIAEVLRCGQNAQKARPRVLRRTRSRSKLVFLSQPFSRPFSVVTKKTSCCPLSSAQLPSKWRPRAHPWPCDLCGLR